MPDRNPHPEPRSEPVGVAAFDFDGTLTHKDTLMPFLARVHGWRRVATAALGGAVRARNGAAPDPFRDRLKIAAIGKLFGGMPAARLDELGRDYAAGLGAQLRPDMVDRLRWHQDRGHVAVIVSASLAAYLRPLAVELGIDDVLAVELVSDAEGFLTGAVAGGANTRGPHKQKRLRAWTEAHFGAETPIELWAYGDSVGDRDLLAWADHPTWVRGRRSFPSLPGLGGR